MRVFSRLLDLDERLGSLINPGESVERMDSLDGSSEQPGRLERLTLHLRLFWNGGDSEVHIGSLGASFKHLYFDDLLMLRKDFIDSAGSAESMVTFTVPLDSFWK